MSHQPFSLSKSDMKYDAIYRTIVPISLQDRTEQFLDTCLLRKTTKSDFSPHDYVRLTLISHYNIRLRGKTRVSYLLLQN